MFVGQSTDTNLSHLVKHKCSIKQYISNGVSAPIVFLNSNYQTPTYVEYVRFLLFHQTPHQNGYLNCRRKWK